MALVALLLPAACGGPTNSTPTPTPTPVSYCTAPPSEYAVAVTDWWLPNCSVAQNEYNDPTLALGEPDARRLGGGLFSGFVSLGFGGFVTLDMAGCIADQPGPDVRVFQAVSNEPLSLYASETPDGPYVLLRPRQPCGQRVTTVIKYCDFDLAEGGLSRARYFKVQDGELWPCPGDTTTEGPDLDGMQALGVAAP